MFKQANLYYFADFKFNDGGDPQNKYFIVLKEMPDGVIIGTLPTSANKIPSFVTINHGCININERMYNCYLFQKDKSICKSGFCFDRTTFIYGSDIDYYMKEKMEKDYPIEGKHFKHEGELTEQEYKDIIECLCKSNAVKKGIQRKLLSK